jgi:hypothetical protein
MADEKVYSFIFNVFDSNSHHSGPACRRAVGKTQAGRGNRGGSDAVGLFIPVL